MGSQFHQSSCSLSTLVSEPSVHQLSERHCRERLIIDTSEWTSRHVELLGFNFQEAVPAPHIDIKPSLPKDSSLTRYIHRLSTHWKYVSRSLAFSSIIALVEGPYQHLNNLHFYFNDRHVRELPCIVFFPGDDRLGAREGRVPPVTTYINSKKINEVREGSLRGIHGGRYNKPAGALYDIKSKKLTLPDAYRDLYIIVLLIAIAYRQQDALAQRNINTLVFLSYIFFTKEREGENIHLFSANIPPTLLNKLNHPSIPIPTQGSSPIAIQHIIIPFLPHENFRDRVLLALRPPDYMTNFDATFGRTWAYQEVPPTLPTRSPLRRRKSRYQ